MHMRHLALGTLLLAVTTTMAAAQRDSTISVQGIGGVRLCQPLSAVPDRFPLARDTVMESEGVRWPAKVVPLSGGWEIVFEASWIDTSHVWHISTNRPRYRGASELWQGLGLCARPATARRSSRCYLSQRRCRARGGR